MVFIICTARNGGNGLRVNSSALQENKMTEMFAKSSQTEIMNLYGTAKWKP